MSDTTSDPGLDEHDGDTDAAPVGPRERRTVPAGAFVLAVMVAMALAVLAVVGFTMDSGTGAGDQNVRLAAGRFAERFLSFDHAEIDQWKDDVLALSTGGFANEVENVEEGLRRLIADSELDADTQVTDIFVGELDRGAVDVVVTYDRDLSGSSGSRSEDNRYMQLSMVRVDDQWLVDNVIDIASASGAVLPSDGSGGAGSTTSTTPATTTTTDGGA